AGGEIWGDLRQTDTYFAVATGRLKLRETAGFSAELIHYERNEEATARPSDYVSAAVQDAAATREGLSRALGGALVGSKRRTLLLIGTTRIHLDDVEGLGRFLEIEVPVQSREDGGLATEAAATALADLVSALGYTFADGIRRSYFDLLKDRAE